MTQQYIGVYATNEKTPVLEGLPRHLGTRKRLWFAWKMPEDKYSVQPLNAVHQPMSAPRIVSSKEFSDRFTYEANCFLAPEGAVHPEKQEVDASSFSLPALFLNDTGIPLSFPASMESDEVLADDPKLLLQWARGERRPKVPSTDSTKISFDRLVEEVDSLGYDEEASPSVASVDAGAVPKTEEETKQVRQLRSRFVQALLFLRRGARAEGTALLEEILKEPHEYFEGGSQLFSEFGLGLRRLGFASLSLAAHKRALAFAPQNERVLFNLARSCHDMGMVIEAMDYLEQALVVAPDFAAAGQFLNFLKAADGPAKE